ncbi:hypothetical protein [Streptomyces marispadix]|uniref:SMP-30/Gluconolactonase/LRE-like region domain-containing protein n=1 Tax=Streptomyces marispadix TaxID=2922868 RepID=A0ABS9SZP5_9ACTN|nr:hypothetical protein [Streptomyces marispadix]MCH6161748.1 hypothetical protein [Streptomyces marispadix]
MAAITSGGLTVATPAYADAPSSAGVEASVSYPSEDCRVVFDRASKGATDAVVDSTGKNLYVTDAASNGVGADGTLYRKNLATGVAKEVADGLGHTLSMRSDHAGGVFVSGGKDGDVWHLRNLEARDTKVDLAPSVMSRPCPAGPLGRG